MGPDAFDGVEAGGTGSEADHGQPVVCASTKARMVARSDAFYEEVTGAEGFGVEVIADAVSQERYLKKLA